MLRPFLIPINLRPYFPPLVFVRLHAEQASCTALIRRYLETLGLLHFKPVHKRVSLTLCDASSLMKYVTCPLSFEYAGMLDSTIPTRCCRQQHSSRVRVTSASGGQNLSVHILVCPRSCSLNLARSLSMPDSEHL